MSISSSRRNLNSSRASSMNTLRSDDFESPDSRSSSPSSSSSYESELASIRTDNRSVRSSRSNKNNDRPPSQFGSSTLFLKPPIVPPRKTLILNNENQKEKQQLQQQQQEQTLKLNNDDLNSSFTDSIVYSTRRNDTIDLPHLPAEKLSKSEQMIQKMFSEFNIMKESHAKEVLLESLLDEHIVYSTLNMLSFGELNINYAKSSLKLADFYLNYKNYPKQAKLHCENGLSIMKRISQKENNQEFNETTAGFYYIIGRACTVLKKNKNGAAYLEKAERYLKDIEKSENSLDKQVIELKKRINIALAKQFAINEKYTTALVYYDNAINVIKKNESNESIEIVGLLIDKAKIKQNQEDYDQAVALIEDAINIAEKNASIVHILDCKLELAKVYASYNEYGQTLKADQTFESSIDSYKQELGSTNTKYLEAIDEHVKFLLKQNDRYEDAKKKLKQLIQSQKEALGDFHLSVAASYKLLSSVYLKQNDMPNAALNLKKCLEAEELNYGPTNKAVQSTKESLENLKKNPSVMQVLNIKTAAEKPKFSTISKIDNRKQDLELYKPKDDEASLNTSRNNRSLNTSLTAIPK